MALYHSVRELLPLKSIIKEVIDNLGIDSENVIFLSSPTVYEDNNGSIGVATIQSMTPKSKHISVMFHCFGQHIRKEFLVRKIKLKN